MEDEIKSLSSSASTFTYTDRYTEDFQITDEKKNKTSNAFAYSFIGLKWTHTHDMNKYVLVCLFRSMCGQ